MAVFTVFGKLMGKQFPPDLREIEMSIGSNVSFGAECSGVVERHSRNVLSGVCSAGGGGEGGDAGGGTGTLLVRHRLQGLLRWQFLLGQWPLLKGD